MTRYYTRELKAEMALGRIIMCSMAPYEGEPVRLAPRRKSDPEPWVYTDHHGTPWRYRGRECHAVAVCASEFLNGKKCVKPIGHNKACSTR